MTTALGCEDDETFELALDVFGRAAVPDGIAGAEPEDLAPALEAVCFSLNRAGDRSPRSARSWGAAPAAVAAAAEALAGQLRGRGLMLQRHERSSSSWSPAPRPPGRCSAPSTGAADAPEPAGPGDPGDRRLPPAADPRGIEAIRGVNCEAVLDSLERRGLIAEVGPPGHPGPARACSAPPSASCRSSGWSASTTSLRSATAPERSVPRGRRARPTPAAVP